MLRDVPLRGLIVISFLAAGLIPVMIVALISYSAGKNELVKQVFSQLEASRNLKKLQLENLFARAVADVEMLAGNPFLLAAANDLQAAFAAAGGAAGGQFQGAARGYRSPPAYQTEHDRYFPVLAEFVGRLGYYDVLLLEPSRGEVFFTVKKEDDFGADASGSDSPLGDVWRRSVAEGQTVLSDTRSYQPSGNAPAQFVAAPVRHGGQIAAVAVLQVPLDAINAIMAESDGLGATGETYLVGPDLRMRSDALLDPLGRSVSASLQASVERGGVATVASRLALGGETGARIIADYRGQQVLSAFAPVSLPGLRWAIIAEVDEQEIEAKITAGLNRKILLVLGFAIAEVLLLYTMISRLMQRQLRTVASHTAQLTRTVLDGRLDARGESAAVGPDFRGIIARINDLIAAFAKVTAEKQQLEARVQRIARLEAIGTLASGIAHDFNNILTILYAHAELLQPELEHSQRGQHILNASLTAVDRASELVRQILTFNRQMQKPTRPLDVTPLVQDVAQLLQTTLPGTVKLELQTPPQPIYINADQAQVQQILLNLAANAVHAMEQTGGTLSIAVAALVIEADGSQVSLVRQPGRYCLLAVTDTGHGMDAVTRDRMFEPFFTTKPVGQGTGLGLSLVHGIVASYGGAIDVWSEPGCGTRIDILIPTADGPG